MTNILHKASECDTPNARDVCIFLAEYSARLLAAGATCIRLDKNVNRIASAYCMDAEMAIMPRHIHMTVVDNCTGEILTSIAAVNDSGANFTVNTLLSRLSWAIADEKIEFKEAVERFERIIEGRRQNKWFVLLLVTIANASFCRLFGGDPAAMASVGAATFIGFFIKQLLVVKKFDTRIVFIICSFISSMIGASCMLSGIGETPTIAIGTSVLYLVPGIPFLNSFSDLLYRHYICAFGRFADALVLTCCLSIGLCFGMMLLHVGMF